MAKAKEFKISDGVIMTGHDMATAKLVANEFSKIFGFHHACCQRIEEKIRSGEYSQKDIESLDMHKGMIRGLTRITAVAECALYHEAIDYYAVENAAINN